MPYERQRPSSQVTPLRREPRAARRAGASCRCRRRRAGRASARGPSLSSSTTACSRSTSLVAADERASAAPPGPRSARRRAARPRPAWSRPLTDSSPSGSSTNAVDDALRRRLADGDRPRLGGRLQPSPRRSSCRRARPTADRHAPTRPTAVSPVLMPTRRLKSEMPQAASTSRAYSRDDVDDRERRPGGALGVVLVRGRDAEERGDAVAHVRLHGAAEPLDRARHAADALADDDLHLVRGEALAERRRADDVGEERGDRPQLVLGGGLRSRRGGGARGSGATGGRASPRRRRARA